MTARRKALTFLFAAVISHSVGCGRAGSGNGSSSNTSQPSVSIALNPAPSSTSIPVGNTAGIQFTPVVSNDPGNYGVDWAVTCSLSSTAGACGTLSIPTYHSASGTTVSYIPPATLPAGTPGSLIVNVTAFATADHTKNVTTAVTVTPGIVTSFTNVLKGTYILQVMGSDSNLQPYQSTGVFVFDGNGNITSGQQTLNTVSGFSTSYTLQGSNGSPSTYFIGSDGRGTITLNVQSSATGGTTETFTFVVLSSSKALVAELDLSSGTGTLELQDSAAAATMPTGAYAFVTRGSDSGVFTNPNTGLNVLPTAIGGVINIDNNPSPGSISGKGSLADQDYYDTTGTKAALQSCVPPTGVRGSVSQPSTLGAVTIALTGATCFGIQQPGMIQFTGYIVDATHIRLIESDDVNGSGGFLTAGIAVSQGTAAGTFTNASLLGPYVLGVLGYDLTDYSFGVPGFSFTSAAVLSADGNGTLTTGITDTFYPGALSNIGLGAYNAAPLTGSYVMDANFIGRAELKPKFNGSPKPQPNVLFYLTGNGTPPLVLWSEGEDVNFPAIGTGIAYPQAANASSLSFGNPETYGVAFTQNPNAFTGAEGDGSGNMTSTIGVTGTLTGTLDEPGNNGIIGSGFTPFPLLDTFSLPADSFGRISGTFMNMPGSGTAGPNVDYYLVNGHQGFLVENDLPTTSTVTLGYFSQACDVTNATACQSAAKQVPPKRASRRSSSRSLRR